MNTCRLSTNIQRPFAYHAMFLGSLNVRTTSDVAKPAVAWILNKYGEEGGIHGHLVAAL